MKFLPPDLARVLLDRETIQARVEGLAAQIDGDYTDAKCVHLIGILKGAFIFLADLSRRLQVPHVVNFMSISSYGKTTTSGEVRILMDLPEPIEGQHVIIVEDILDTGHTLEYLCHTLQARNPASLKTCVFVRKERTGIDMPLDYLGFTIPDVWVVGYGLDYAEKHRTLPYIAEVRR
ncbi:MAG: hypoxanthine phosphoribosyltransferase [Chloroflexota bacterium]